MKQLPGKNTADSERLAHLEAYIKSCIGQSIFSWADLINGRAKDRLLNMISQDIKVLGNQTLERGKQVFDTISGVIFGR